MLNLEEIEKVTPEEIKTIDYGFDVLSEEHSRI